MQPFAHQVGQVAERQDIVGAVERQAVLEGQTLAGFYLFANRHQTGIVNYDLHVVQAPGLRRKISAAQNTKNNTLT